MDEDQDDFLYVERIECPNAMEEAAQRYWRASRIWRDKEESTWNCGMMIQELNDIRCYRGKVGGYATQLLDDVVHDRRHSVLELLPQHQLPSNDEVKHGME